MAEELDLGPEADFRLAGLSVWVRSRQFPNMHDFWDGNWLNIRAIVEASGSCVEIYGPVLRNEELAAFAEELRVIDQQLSGSAELRCIEPNLHLKVSFESLGHIQLIVDITPDHMNQSHRFEFGIDQSSLIPLLAACKRIANRFPVRGAVT